LRKLNLLRQTKDKKPTILIFYKNAQNIGFKKEYEDVLGKIEGKEI